MHLHGAVEGGGGGQDDLLHSEFAHMAAVLVDAQAQVSVHQARDKLHHLLPRHLPRSKHRASDNTSFAATQTGRQAAPLQMFARRDKAQQNSLTCKRSHLVPQRVKLPSYGRVIAP